MPVVSPTYYALWPSEDIHSANICALDNPDWDYLDTDPARWNSRLTR